MRRKQAIIAVVVLVFTIAMGAWCMDTSVTMLINDGMLTNGFLSMRPAQTYHLGLWTMLIGSIMLAFLVIEQYL